MNIQEDVSLKPFNTFGVEVSAKFFIEVKTEDELIELCQSDFLKDKQHLVLGSGSNILFTKNFDGVVIKNSIEGIQFKKSGKLIRVIAGGGTNWHNLVIKSLENGANGLENLSLIPGTVGAAPVQNIGAYGLELKNVFEQLRSVEIATGKVQQFTKAQCSFKYRSSAFKEELKGKYIITEVTLDLHNTAEVNINYAPIRIALEKKGIDKPTSKDVADVVMEIRNSKLPDPAKIGNAGSFFKNPVIAKVDYKELQFKFNGMPAFPQAAHNKVKIPAAWLIEHAGWKGKRIEHIGVSETQALVLVNYGKGTGRDIKDLSKEIQASVYKKYKIKLEVEVNIL
ncbi:MAG: UDP-N-acetylmuramate dehydrogenase [Cyclobacteriaceae bacterium]|nr:UDP-N-acetylmuramate dehydrogenase [Cyclobacteriaceae bacterium]